MTKKGELRFDLKLPDRLGKAGLPIEVRSSDRKLVGRYESLERVEVDPGSYYVSVRLPSGDELTDWVDVTSGTSSTAQLAADEITADIDIESQFVLAPNMQVQHVQRPSEEYVSERSFELLKKNRAVDSSQPIGVRAWRGTIGAYEPLDSSAFTVDSKRGTTSVIVPAPKGNEQHLLQLLVPDRAVSMFVLPCLPWGKPIKTVIVQVGDELVFDAHLENELADVMIRDGTEITRTERLGQAMEAQGLLHAKTGDPIAAAAGAVALLGIDQAERVQGWLRNLAEWFDWLPDGAALAAEAYARDGKHEDAVQMLLLLENRGVPLFSDSLAFAIDRLNRYMRASEVIGDRPAIERVFNRLRPYAEYRFSGRALTTFRALDPDEPSDKKCPMFLPADARTVSLQRRSRQRSL